MKYKCFIFDLDGTLIDSLQGILDAVNLTFKQFGYNVQRTFEEGKSFIGSGAVEFARRAMKGTKIPAEKERDVMESFLKNYDEIQKVATKPFNGILEMLEKLENNGAILTIASNKPQVLLDPIVPLLFPNIGFKISYGQRENKPCKPDPYMIFEIMKALKLDPTDCLYVGDSEYDYKTAYNAGIDCVICKYGFGFYDKPYVKKATYIVETVKELEELLLR